RPISSSSRVVMPGSIALAMACMVFATILPMAFRPSSSSALVIVMPAYSCHGTGPVPRAPLTVAAHETRRFLGGAAQGAAFVHGLHELGLGVAVIDDTATRLNVKLAVLDHPGTQGDTHVHLAIGSEIPYAPGIDSALFRLKLVDDLHRADLW